MAGESVSMLTHEVDRDVSLTTRSRTFVPFDGGRHVELPLMCCQSPANSCAHVGFKPLLFGREDGRRWFCLPCIVPIFGHVARRL